MAIPVFVAMPFKKDMDDVFLVVVKKRMIW